MSKKVVPEGSFPEGIPGIPWSEADGIFVQKLNGEKVSLSSLYKNKKTALVFLRQFDCPTCYTYTIFYSHLRPLLERADIQLVFITCHGDLSEIALFIKNFAYWLREISPDGLKPLPGDLYMDPERNAYRFFGLYNGIKKTDAFEFIAMGFKRFFGMLLTARKIKPATAANTISAKEKQNSVQEKTISERHAFHEIMYYVRNRMSALLPKSRLTADSVVWQSPGLCVIHQEKLIYRVILLKK